MSNSAREYAIRTCENARQSIRTAIEALNYLEDHPRPNGGQEKFNAEHLLQIADELKQIVAKMVQASDWPKDEEKTFILQAKSKGSEEWIRIYPAQLQWVIKAGHEVRAIEC